MKKNVDFRFETTARRSGLLAASITAILCVPAFAAENTDQDVARVLDAFNPYATLGYGYDSNIFRLDDAVPETDDGRSDQYAMVSAGFNTEITRSLQRYEFYGEVNHTLFSEHSDLDYTGSKAGAIWDWNVAGQAIGTAGITHSRALRDFANQLALVKVKDVRMENAIYGDANWDWTGPWEAGLRGELADVSFSENERLDLLRYTFGGSVGYTSSAGSTFGLDAQLMQGDYDENPLADFNEYFVGPTLEWHFTERSLLLAKVGYANRDQSDPLRTDYDGVTGRVSYTLDNEERNGLTVALYRDLSNLGDEISDFAAVTGIEIEPRWQLRDGLDIRFMLGYEQRDFNRDPEAELLGLDPNRDDDVITGGAFVDWQITRNIKLSFSADLQQRDSTRELQDYDFNRFEVKITGSI